MSRAALLHLAQVMAWKLSKRRAIVPANGYYEWMIIEEGKKIPYFLRGDGDVIAMAGLYELWPDLEVLEEDPDKWVWTCTVLTRPATDSAGHIHDRSPLILPESFWEHWRGPNLTDKGRGLGHDQFRSGAASRTVRSPACGQ